MKATKAPESGVKHVMTTIWGDEGNECDVYVGSSLLTIKANRSARYSCLPGLYYYAEHGYTRDPEVDVTLLKLKFGMCSCLCSDVVDLWPQMAS